MSSRTPMTLHWSIPTTSALSVLCLAAPPCSTLLCAWLGSDGSETREPVMPPLACRCTPLGGPKRPEFFFPMACNEGWFGRQGSCHYRVIATDWRWHWWAPVSESHSMATAANHTDVPLATRGRCPGHSPGASHGWRPYLAGEGRSALERSAPRCPPRLPPPRSACQT